MTVLVTWERALGGSLAAAGVGQRAAAALGSGERTVEVKKHYVGSHALHESYHIVAVAAQQSARVASAPPVAAVAHKAAFVVGAETAACAAGASTQPFITQPRLAEETYLVVHPDFRI